MKNTMHVGLGLIFFALAAMMINNWIVYKEVEEIAFENVAIDNSVKAKLELEKEKMEVIKNAKFKNDVISYICLAIGLALVGSSYGKKNKF